MTNLRRDPVLTNRAEDFFPPFFLFLFSFFPSTVSIVPRAHERERERERDTSWECTGARLDRLITQTAAAARLRRRCRD